MPTPRYCMFCEAEAVYKIMRSSGYLCEPCKDAYESGQSNPDGELKELD